MQRFAPPVFEDEEKTASARILYLVTWFTFLIGAFITVVMLFMLPQNTLRWEGIGLLFALMCLGVNVLNRKGHVRRGAILYMVMAWALLAVAAFTSGGLRSMSVGAFPLMVFLGGLLLGRSGAIATAVVFGVTGLGLLLVEQAGLLPASTLDHRSLSRWMGNLIYIAVVVCIQALALERLSQSLRRAEEELAERRRANQALRESEQRLARAEHTAHVGSWSLDVVRNALTWSDELYRIYGADPSVYTVPAVEVFERALHPDDRPRVLRALRDRLEGKPIAFEEFRIVLPDGTPRTLRSFDIDIETGAGGEPLRMFGAIQDITELKRAEAEKALLEAQLLQSQKMEAVGQLAGGVAHDFNNLLTIIGGYGALLVTGLDPETEMRKAAETITQAVEHGSALTRQLLAFSRKQRLEPKIFDLNEVLAGTGRLLTHLVPSNIQMQIVPAPQSSNVLIDSSQFEQVIMNLVVNAAEAMPGGGKLILETSHVDLDDAYERANPEVRAGRYVRLSIADTGCGIQADVMGHIFEPFYTTKAKGTGLGLATVFGIVKQSHGHVSVHSEVDHGSTFNIYLPVAESQEEEVEPVVAGGQIAVQAVASRDPGSELILLAEDEDILRNLLRTVLERDGNRVIAARDGLEALSLFESSKESISLLVSDVIMPGIRGDQLGRRFLALNPGGQVILISGDLGDLDSLESLLAGPLAARVHFVQKPFTPRSLTEKVRSVLDGVKAEG